MQALKSRREQLDPFGLAESIEHQLEHIWELANRRQSPKVRAAKNATEKASPGEQEALQALSDMLAMPVYVKERKKTIMRLKG